VNVTYFSGDAVPPFAPNDMEHIPYQLYNAGVTDEEWAEFVKRLVEVNNIRRPCTFLIGLTLVFLPCPWYCYCRQATRDMIRWEAELRKWQDDFNKEVLIRQGCFVKTKSFASLTYVRDDDGGHNERCKNCTAYLITVHAKLNTKT